ncbi:MAG TPA: hypothetical protein VIM51_00340 [Desulfosporosinus sp.]
MKAQFEAAIIEEQGKTFALVSVQSAVFQNSSDTTTIIKALLPTFNGIPVVLVTRDDDGKPAYYGRGDLVALLENVNINEAPWRQMDAELELANACPVKEMEEES